MSVCLLLDLCSQICSECFGKEYSKNPFRGLNRFYVMCIVYIHFIKDSHLLGCYAVWLGRYFLVLWSVVSAFIIRVERSVNRISPPSAVITHTYRIHPVHYAQLYFFLNCLTLKMKTLWYFRMPGDTHPLTQYHIPGEKTCIFSSSAVRTPDIICDIFIFDVLEYLYMKFEPI